MIQLIHSSIIYLGLLLVFLLVEGALGGPVVATSGSTCSVPQPSKKPTSSSCSPGSSSIEDAKSKAWIFAPIVKFHPYEKYYLQSMPEWYAASRLVPPADGLKEYRTLLGDGNDNNLLDGLDPSLIQGAPFVTNATSGGENGTVSSADVYYTVQPYTSSDGGQFWLYNYDLFFSWNGCSNQEFALAGIGTAPEQYVMCPAGEHECDLERLSVLVCASDFSIQYIGYNQHAWSEVRDCGATEDGQNPCNLDSETGHPIVYTALQSHALYPEDSGFHVYFNLGPLYVGDRTGDDPTKKFVPTRDNIKFIESRVEDVPQSSEWDWARFSGNWGKLLQQNTPIRLECFSDTNIAEYVACPDSQATSLILTVAQTQDLAKPANEQFMNGPLFRPETYQISGSHIAPILESGAESILCPQDVYQRSTESVSAVDENAQDRSTTVIRMEPPPPPPQLQQQGTSSANMSAEDSKRNSEVSSSAVVEPPTGTLPPVSSVDHRTLSIFSSLLLATLIVYYL